MLHALRELVGPAVIHRGVLFANHVLAAEPVATRRLAAHQGRTLRIELRQWPALLPAPPSLVFRITPAGLVEWPGDAPEPAADLTVSVAAADPLRLGARLARGGAPEVDLQGDAALAADVNFVLSAVRWDVAGDLERFIGPAASHQIVRFGAAIAAEMRAALQRSAALAGRLRRSP